jgi:hypothetical protein
VTGGSLGSGSGSDYATLKYSSTGSQTWVARYNGPANGDDVSGIFDLRKSRNFAFNGMATRPLVCSSEPLIF